MRNRFLAALTFLALLVVPATLHAQMQLNRWVYDPVTWRTSTTSTLGYLDTLSMVSEAGGSAATADTTAPISLVKYAIPPYSTNNSAADDSVAFLEFVFVPANYTTSAGTAISVAHADSFFVRIQVSLDGVNWVTMTPNSAFPASGAQAGEIILEAGSSNTFARIYKTHIDDPQGFFNASVNGATAPTDLQWFGWRFVRFIVQGDFNGRFEGMIGHWSYE